ncbi:MAG: hypothetical protein RBR74_03390 [Ignavibacteriaceae bacterium]|jgi:cytochrome bd-type quinol oxidase subunit 2|nr:hypothetical protein [Ignavibacteriaceae bacterium]
MSDKKFIKDIYLVQTFQNYFQIYVRILLALTILIALLIYIVRRTGGFLGDIVNPFIRILIIIIASTAVVFIPYILYVLIKENRKGWISFLILLLIIPVLFVSLIFKLSVFHNFAALYPIFLYSLFCYLLRAQINEWLTEYYGHQNRLEQKRLKKEEEEKLKNDLF